MIYNEEKGHFFNFNKELQSVDMLGSNNFARGGPTQTILFVDFF